jgi:hypothetical protein
MYDSFFINFELLQINNACLCNNSSIKNLLFISYLNPFFILNSHSFFLLFIMLSPFCYLIFLRFLLLYLLLRNLFLYIYLIHLSFDLFHIQMKLIILNWSTISYSIFLIQFWSICFKFANWLFRNFNICLFLY